MNLGARSIAWIILFAPRKRACADSRAAWIGPHVALAEKRREVVISYEQSGDTTEDVAYVELDLKDAEPGGQEVRVKVTDLLAEPRCEEGDCV